MKDLEKKLSTLSERSGIPTEDLGNKYKEYLKAEVEKGTKETVTEDKAFLRLVGEISDRYEAITKSKATMWRGYLIGDSGRINRAEFLIRKARAMWDDPDKREEAKLLGLVSEDGVVLDTRDKVYGRPNPNYGKPLPEDLPSRIIECIVYNSDVPERARLMVDQKNKAILDADLKLFTPCQFRATLSKEEDDVLTLNTSKYTVFEEIDLNVDIATEILNTVPTYDLLQLEDLIAREKQMGKKDTFVALDVVVRNISDDVGSGGSRRIVVIPTGDQIEPSLTCFMPTHLPIDFTEYSRVIVLGRPSKGSRKFKDNIVEDLRFNVRGVYTYPDYRSDGTTPVTTEEAIANPWVEKQG